MKCNMDCFNCQYPDCINNDLTTEDYRESAARDKVNITDKQRYHRKNSRDYHVEHREERNAKQRKYNQEHKSSETKRKRDWYLRNHEYVLQYNRERYWARKKAERVS